MPSAFERQFQARGVRALNRQHAVDVSYSRDGVVTQPITTRRSDRSYSVIGSKMRSEQMVMMRDYVIPVVALSVYGTGTEPRTGDRIIEAGETFELAPISDAQPAAELLPGGFEWLVHTKRFDFQTKTGRGYRGES